MIVGAIESTNDARRIACNDAGRQNVTYHDAACANHAVVSDGHAKENDRAATDPHIVPDAVSPHVRFKPMILPVPFLPDAAFSLMI
jgi:hypothetical protein